MPSIANAGLKNCGERLTQFTNVFSVFFALVFSVFSSLQAANANTAAKPAAIEVIRFNFILSPKIGKIGGKVSCSYFMSKEQNASCYN